MASRRIGDKSLSEQMLTLFTDAYMRHQGEMSCKPKYRKISFAQIISRFQSHVFNYKKDLPNCSSYVINSFHVDKIYPYSIG